MRATPREARSQGSASTSRAPGSGGWGRVPGLGDVSLGLGACPWAWRRVPGLGDVSLGLGACPRAWGRVSGLGDVSLVSSRAACNRVGVLPRGIRLPRPLLCHTPKPPTAPRRFRTTVRLRATLTRCHERCAMALVGGTRC
eukprot:scaffold13770_cov136-Isochrysis_galbana.AAC.1